MREYPATPRDLLVWVLADIQKLHAVAQDTRSRLILDDMRTHTLAVLDHVDGKPNPNIR